MNTHFSFQRTYSVARKEFLHIIRDPATLFFALFIPVLELFMLGYAIDTNVRHISHRRPRPVPDQGQPTAAAHVRELQGLRYRRARLHRRGAEPGDRRRQSPGRHQDPRRLLRGRRSEATGTDPGAGGRLRVEHRRRGAQRQQRPRPCRNRSSSNSARQPAALAIEMRPRILFNPDTRSANFFIPGLMVVMCQMMAIMLSANAIVREKEKGHAGATLHDAGQGGRADPRQAAAVPGADVRRSSAPSCC